MEASPESSDKRLWVCVYVTIHECNSKQCDNKYSAVSSFFDYRLIKINFLHTKSYVSAPFYTIDRAPFYAKRSCYQQQNTNEHVRLLSFISLRRILNGGLPRHERETCVGMCVCCPKMLIFMLCTYSCSLVAV